MKKFSVFVSIIFLAISLVACAGHGLPPAPQTAQTAPSKAGWQTVPPKSDYDARLNKTLERIETIMKANTTAVKQAKIPTVEASAISSPVAPATSPTKIEITTVVPTNKTTQRLTALEKKVNRLEKTSRQPQKLISRVARLEDIVEYAHPKVDTSAVTKMTAGKTCCLSEVAKKYLDSLAQKVTDGKIVIKEIIGYADKSPAPAGTNNKAIALHRAESVAQYLSAKGVNMTAVAIKGGCATDRYGAKKKNRRVQIIYEKK